MSLLTPVFMLSGATVMCDTMMLAMYVWAVFFWVKGIRRGSYGNLLCASLLVGLCSLTKYYGMSLIPLLLLYTLFTGQGRKQGGCFWWSRSPSCAAISGEPRCCTAEAAAGCGIVCAFGKSA